jgi:hypothetical protein
MIRPVTTTRRRSITDAPRLVGRGRLTALDVGRARERGEWYIPNHGTGREAL